MIAPASRRWLARAVSLIAALAALACEPVIDDNDPCGLGIERPDIAPGSARFLRDGVLTSTTGGGYKLDFPNDIVVGMITMNIKQDTDRRLVADLIDTNSFPICVPLDAADDGSGYAIIEDGLVSYSTSASHTGMLAILTKQDSALIGRFGFVAAENHGDRITRIEQGAFYLFPR